MTIKARNRINLAFCIFYAVLTGLYIFHFVYQIAHNSFILPEVFFAKEPGTNFFFNYNKKAVLFSLFFISAIVTALNFVIFRAFGKTQSVIVNYFLVFLFAIFCDTSRFFIIISHCSGTCSELLLFLGNISLFARILAPLSLIMIVFSTYDEQVQNLNRNFLLLILFSLFMTFSIPLNTTKILPVFCVSYSFRKTIMVISILTTVLNVTALAFYNYRNLSTQKTTIGFALLSFGYLILLNCTTFFMLTAGTLFLTAGSYLYLYNLHTNFLWR